MNACKLAPRTHVPVTQGTIGMVDGVQPGFKARVGRLVFISALYFKITGNENPDEDALERVNRHFKVAFRPQALLFPAVLSTLLWRKVDVQELIAQYRANVLSLQQIATALLACTPGILRYTSRMAMAQDIKAVCEFASMT